MDEERPRISVRERTGCRQCVLEDAHDIIPHPAGEERPVRGPPAVADYLGLVFPAVDPAFEGGAVVEAARPHPAVQYVPDEQGLHRDYPRAGGDALESVTSAVP